jgi:uncharacterized membrane protein
VVVIGPCILGVFLAPIVERTAAASPSTEVAERAAAVDLRLTQRSVVRVLADLSGAAQEADAEKPKSMEEQAAGKAKPAAAAVKKEAPPPDPYAFVKDWPFWVIVGGVVIAGVGGYMLLRNSNDKAPCDARFTAGCFPS